MVPSESADGLKDVPVPFRIVMPDFLEFGAERVSRLAGVVLPDLVIGCQTSRLLP
jgi:hypothetical protein